jgi:predicted nucleic acid-binding protein
MPVVDASVCVALFKLDEPSHASSRLWLLGTGQEDEPVVSPAILLSEVASALGRGLGNEALARQSVTLLRSRRLVELFPVTEALAARAAEIASEQKLRGCDAIYVALARQLDMELVTLDHQQLERGSAVVRTRTP